MLPAQVQELRRDRVAPIRLVGRIGGVEHRTVEQTVHEDEYPCGRRGDRTQSKDGEQVHRLTWPRGRVDRGTLKAYMKSSDAAGLDHLIKPEVVDAQIMTNIGTKLPL